jgi:hypothetical protein
VIAFRIAYFLIPLPIGLSALLISELVFANRPRMKKAPFVTRNNESVG